MTNSLPKISVVTVSFNQARFIRDCIESVKNQDYPNIEHIIIDGGSTDGTVDILKEYPHLNWVSEPDRGQTHALNKGFRKCTGEIIGWLNSDDYYTTGALSIVARELSHHAVLLGEGKIVDEAGAEKGSVPNIERNWFDVLKNWIYHSSFLQPAVFFRKDALDTVKLDSGLYLDEDLHYVMDYDLWLRMGIKFQFLHRVSAPLACFRVYDESKTGTAKASTDHEIRRVYSKYSALITRQECSTSYIIPFKELDRSVFETIDSINSQSLVDLEVILCPFGDALSTSDYQTKTEQLFPRLRIRSAGKSPALRQHAIKQGVAASRGGLCMILECGTLLSQDFNFELIKLFSIQSLGAVIPFLGRESQLKPFYVESNGLRLFNAEALLSEPSVPSNIIFRKTALLELEQIFDSEDSFQVARKELFRLLYKGWIVNINNALRISQKSEAQILDTHSIRTGLGRSIAEMICDIDEERQHDPFSVVRIEHGFSVVVPDESVQYCRSILGR